MHRGVHDRTLIELLLIEYNKENTMDISSYITSVLFIVLGIVASAVTVLSSRKKTPHLVVPNPEAKKAEPEAVKIVPVEPARVEKRDARLTEISPELQAHIVESRAAGMAERDIQRMLIDNGWKEEFVVKARSLIPRDHG